MLKVNPISMKIQKKELNDNIVIYVRNLDIYRKIAQNVRFE